MPTKIHRYLLFTLVITLLLSISCAETTGAQGRQPMQKGMSYVGWWSGDYAQPDSELALRHLAATGANWISLIVTGYQANLSSTTISFTTPRTPTDPDLAHAITEAHRLGLKVMLKPHVDLLTANQWRGQIGEGFATEEAWTTWFASYHNFIGHYASLAQIYRVEQFAIGTELVGTTHRENDWRAIIASIRQLYSGPITYAALYDGEEIGITWWDAVDYIGVDAYYELTDKNDPSLAELQAGWAAPLSQLGALASSWNKSIIFTEIGYRSMDGANRNPWHSQGEGMVDLQEQADAYQAAFQSVYAQPWLAGIFWWYWSTYPARGGNCDTDYTPFGKPAGKILQSWYEGYTPSPDYSQVMSIYLDRLGPGWQDRSWDARRNLAATDRVFSGTQAISVTLETLGALSFWHPAFSSDPYYWLEFYLYASADSSDKLSNLWLTLQGDNTSIDECSLNIAPYITGEPPGSEGWQQVRIPLMDWGGVGRSTNGVSIQYRHDAGTISIWVDQVRLVGTALYPSSSAFLPIILKKSSSRAGWKSKHLAKRTGVNGRGPSFLTLKNGVLR